VHIPVAHIEADLRTGDEFYPDPEEMNRRLVDQIADLHFAPTVHARDNLINEGISEERICVTSNTRIDTLHYLLENLRPVMTFDFPGHVIVATIHRRENLGGGVDHACAALSAIAKRNEDVTIVIPLHPNPHIHDRLRGALDGRKHITILTGSGGLQETAVGCMFLFLCCATGRSEQKELMPVQDSLLGLMWSVS